jgi:flagellar hook-associated protein 2
MDSRSAISGLVSGIQYRDLVDQIIAAESRPAQLARDRITRLQSQQNAIKTYRGLLTTLQTAARALRDGSGFDAMTTSSAILTGSRNLVSGSATSLAAPASYNISVTSSTLAQAQKLGSASQPSTSAPLGLAGDFSVNGQVVTLVATDSMIELRDKINALNTGASPTKVGASILSVGTSSHRLVLTSQTTGAAGIALADTAGSVLQSLGLLSAPTTIDPAAVLQAGADLSFTIDGVAFTRTTNIVSDAIEGLTLNFAAAEAGAVTRLTVERFAEGARGSIQAVVDAYNKLVDFLKEQGTSDPEATTRPALYGDSIVRTMRSRLPELMLASVGAAATDLNRPGLAGIALDSTGKLTFDTTKFDAAFKDRLDDVRKLFQQTGSVSGSGLSYVSSTPDSKAGTYAVDVTQLATQSSVTGAGLSGGIFSDDATADTMTITDTRLGKSVSISLTNGMTSAQIVSALSAAFATGGLGLTAADVGGQVQLTQAGYGSGAGITVAYTAGGAPGAEPITAGTYANGLDIAGTIGGLAATGSGQVLLGTSGTDVAGISVRYVGPTLGAVGDATVSLGTGAELERLLTAFVQSNTGFVSLREASMAQTILRQEERADTIEARLEIRRASLLTQFARMESALAQFQNQSQSVTAILGALSQAGGGR